MKKFGLGRKEKSGDDEDSSRGRLFGSRSKGKDSTAPASVNPYAVQQSSSNLDPYAAEPRASFASSSGYGSTGNSIRSASYAPSIASTQPPPYHDNNSQSSFKPDSKSPVPNGGYGVARYGNNHEGYGGLNGYGSDPYGGGSSAGPSAPPRGGYGGLGRSPSQETMTTQAGKEALFGGARGRFEQQQHQQTLPPEDDPAQQASFSGTGATTGVSGAMDMGYGTYQDRQLTAEEEEEEDVQATKQQIRALKQQDVSSTRNALRIAEEAERTGRETLERLGAQGERIHNTEKNLDLAGNQNRLAEAKARELKHLNRSMWAVQISNPYTKSKRERNLEESIIDQHHSDRLERDTTRAAMYQSQKRQDEHQKQLRDPAAGVEVKRNLAQRSKYQFEADSEDEALEDEIDNNLDLLAGAAGRLNQLGRAMGREVDEQNKHIDRIVAKADKVDDGIAMNRARLDRIR